MRCLHPTEFPNSNGPVACGQCLSCRITKRTRWRTRLLLENKYWKGRSLFVTLTYNDDHLPDKEYFKGGNLLKEDVQKFLKRFRRALERSGDNREIKYYAVGEYGEKSSRAHYHIILYNVDINDQKLVESCWKFGFVHFGDSNATTIAYTLGYTLKKMTSEKDFPDGRNPEFAIMSKALGARYLDAIAQRLVKRKLFPVRSLAQYDKFILRESGARPEDLGYKEWDGTFFMDGVRCSLDHFTMTKVAEIVAELIYKVKDINKQAIFDDRDDFIVSQAKWKAHSKRLTHDAYLAKISFERSEEYEEALKKARKYHYTAKKRKKTF